jgi:Rrf2 family protein
LHAMALLAANGRPANTTTEISTRLRASEAHLSKVLQRLAKAGLVASTRGPKGGYSLAKGPGEISLLDVYEAMDGPLAARECLLGEPICAGSQCIFGDLLGSVNAQVRQHLARTTLGDLTGLYGDGNDRAKADNQVR